jgi:WD40 repeat protein
MAELFRYAAFISYSSRDGVFARKLHRALEGYRIPAALGTFRLTDAKNATNRLYPIFRDREELPSGDLGAAIEKALRDSSMLIVVCSPHAARSEWVDKEIRFFEGLGRGRIFAIIADGEPHASEAGNPALECFPPALRADTRRRAGEDAPPEVIAGDARQDGDGFRNAWLKVVAGGIGVNLGRLINRDRIARRNRAIAIAASSTTAIVLVIAAIGYSAVTSERVLFRERAAKNPGSGESLRYLIAATRDASDIVPSAPNAEALLADTPLGVVPSVPFDEWVTRLSPDGARLLTWRVNGVSDAQGDVLLRDARTLQTVAAISGLGYPVFSPASDTFAGIDKSLNDRLRHARLYDARTGRERANLGEASSIFYTRDGERLLVGRWTGDTGLYNAHDGELLGSVGQVFLMPPSVLVTPDQGKVIGAGPALLTRDRAENWTWRDSATGAARVALGKVSQVSLSAEGTRGVVVATDAGGVELTLRDAAGGVVTRFPHAYTAVLGGDSLATFDGGGLITLRNLHDGAPRAEIDAFAHNSSSRYGVFNRTGDRFAAWDAKQGLLFDGRNGARLAALPVLAPREGDPLDVADDHNVVFSPDGARLLATRFARTALYDAVTGHVLWRNDRGVSQVTFSPDSRYVVALSFMNTVLIDARTGAIVFTVRGFQSFLKESVQFSKDSALLLVQNANGGAGATLFRLGEMISEAAGPGRRAAICRANYEAIGPFDEAIRQRPVRSRFVIFDTAPERVDDSVRLRGRPWHPCDWRGLLAADGWRQSLRYWAVRWGAPWDYTADECTRAARGFGCPARR